MASACRAGSARADVIMVVDGKPIETPREFQPALAEPPSAGRSRSASSAKAPGARLRCRSSSSTRGRGRSPNSRRGRGLSRQRSRGRGRRRRPAAGRGRRDRPRSRRRHTSRLLWSSSAARPAAPRDTLQPRRLAKDRLHQRTAARPKPARRLGAMQAGVSHPSAACGARERLHTAPHNRPPLPPDHGRAAARRRAVQHPPPQAAASSGPPAPTSQVDLGSDAA